MFFQRRTDNDVDGQRDGRAAPFGLFHDLGGGLHQIRLIQGLAHFVSGGLQEGIGDTAAHDELVHALGKVVQDFKLGRNLGTADDGKQRMLGRMEDTGHGFEFGGHEQAHAGDLGETDGPFGGSLRAVRRGRTHP